MPKWTVTLRKKRVGTRSAKVGPEWLDDPAGEVYTTTLDGPYDTEADVKTFAEESWRHSTFVSAAKDEPAAPVRVRREKSAQ